MFNLLHLSNDSDQNSLAHRLRCARFRHFESLVASLPRPLYILDLGGTTAYWENRGWAGRNDIQITCLNLVSKEQRYENIIPVTGDAMFLSEYANKKFDVAFSNSMIQELFTFEMQSKMAREIQRVGKAFYVQTPNFWFPVEPHFLFLGWQWMPLNVRVFLVRHRKWGYRGPYPDCKQARRAVEEIRLLRRSELQSLFPTAQIVPERFCGCVKSWTAFGGFPVQ
jgi:hypothetical protein